MTIGRNSKKRARRVAAIRERDGDNCCFCKLPMLFEPKVGMNSYHWGVCAQRETIEHVLDKAKGGGNILENLRLAHRRCNNNRNRHSVEQKVAEMTAQ